MSPLVRTCLRKNRVSRTQRHFRPCVESLETRATPTTFTWTNGNRTGVWEDPKNWARAEFSAVAFPGWNGNAATTNDVARFAPLVNDRATMEKAHELARLEIVTANMS